MTRERVRVLLDSGLSITEIAKNLALSKSTVCYHARRLGHRADARFAKRYDWQAIRRYYERGFSMKQCKDRFGFNGSAWSDAIARGDIVLRSAEEELHARLKRGPVSRSYLKGQLLRLGIRRDVCERCGLSDWRGRPIILALHHVNGDGRDNRFVNILLLCPNCHSQTPNFSGRNVPLRRARARALARSELCRAGAVRVGQTRLLKVVGEAA